MHKRKEIAQNIIHFSRWTRKKFAVLASLGKQIRIGAVRIEVCKQALQKSGVSLQAFFSEYGNLSKNNYFEDELFAEPIVTAPIVVLPKTIIIPRLRKKSHCVLSLLPFFFTNPHRRYLLVTLNSVDQPLIFSNYAN